MIDNLYKHILFKDLQHYIKRTDYFSGYTETEKAWIRKNLNIVGEKELQLLFNDQAITNLSKDQLQQLIIKENLKAGFLYSIPYLNKYKLIYMALSSNILSKNVILLTNNPNCLLWEVKGELDNIIYLKDENGNEANFDFKHIKVTIEDNSYYVFQNEDGQENSSNCKGNNLTQCTNVIFTGKSNNNFIIGSNIIFKVPVSNIIGKAYDIIIDHDEIGLNNDTLKQFIQYNNNQYLDYLDLETLTHQFYVLDTLH